MQVSPEADQDMRYLRYSLSKSERVNGDSMEIMLQSFSV